MGYASAIRLDLLDVVTDARKGDCRVLECVLRMVRLGVFD